MANALSLGRPSLPLAAQRDPPDVPRDATDFAMTAGVLLTALAASIVHLAT